MKLGNYLNGQWMTGMGEGRPLVNPVTGEEIGRADASGIDLTKALAYARDTGGATLQAMSFSERSEVLKTIADTLHFNRDRYFEIARENSGNTTTDASIDIDGAIYTLKFYARIGKSLGSATTLVEGTQDQLVRDPEFFAQHFWTTRPGVAVQINAFNFPSWGMWEKVAQALLAGVPSFIKPATATALLSERMLQNVISAANVPDGALSLLCGSGSGLVTELGPMDSVIFTGSASTAGILRREIAQMDSFPRLVVEADSINATIIGTDVSMDSSLFDLSVREAIKAMSIKAGQLCTNIRRILVPVALVDAFSAALAEKVENLLVGDPAHPDTQVGPLINAAQRIEAETNMAKLTTGAQIMAKATLPRAAAQSSFFAPTMLYCDDSAGADVVHNVEVFGPCLTILPYRNLSIAVDLAVKAKGSLALSLFSEDPTLQSEVLCKLGPWHGRVMVVDGKVGKNHTGHFNVMPQCAHGGPGRAGGGEELGGLRGLRAHMQRTAVQGGPDALSALGQLSAEATL